MSFELAERIADTVLWEGYVLYPYRASAVKNRFRWQFGVLVPEQYSAWGSEPWRMRTECLAEATDSTTLDIRVRCLQVQRRTVEKLSSPDTFVPVERLEVEGRELVSWEEGVERIWDMPGLAVRDLLQGEQSHPLEAASGTETELIRDSSGAVRARLLRQRGIISGRVRISAEADGAAVRIRVSVENQTPWPAGVEFNRATALHHSFNGLHTLLGVKEGAFLSLLDPPEWAAAAAAACSNQHTFPVLVGEPPDRSLVLSSPILLYDYPAIAPESPGDLFDATEIDEILTLRIQTLTDEEKREARATDDRARRVIDRSDALPREVLERLHGAIRHLAPVRDGGANRDSETP